MSSDQQQQAPNTHVSSLATLPPNPESPTTARPLDFDDEISTEATSASNTPKMSSTSFSDEKAQQPSPKPQEEANTAPPPKPPRPLPAHQQAENTLKEAFPDVDAAVVKAVLVASGGNVERSFHALLGMTDPNAQEEAVPPPPPRPTKEQLERQRQLEADERYARQLAEQYNRPRPRMPAADAYEYDDPRRDPRYQREPRRQETSLKANELYDDDHDFFRGECRILSSVFPSSGRFC
ncbi:ubiquitin-binding protein cue5 [Ascosphaera atra]|nr:ubiquitin-binding protein cue5 [Ascosphaera atra]